MRQIHGDPHRGFPRPQMGGHQVGAHPLKHSSQEGGAEDIRNFGVEFLAECSGPVLSRISWVIPTASAIRPP